MTTPYYLTPNDQGEAYQPDIFDRIDRGITSVPPEGWFSLASALSGNKNDAKGLSQGLLGLTQATQAQKRKASLAEALKGMSEGMTPQQRQLLGVMEPEQAAGILGQKLFGGGGKSWQAQDLDQDGRPDVQIDSSTGKIEAYPLNIKERAFNMLFESGVAPIAPGLGVDRRGSVVPMGGQPTATATQEPRAYRPATPEEEAAGYQAAPPPGTSATSQTDAPITLTGDALARMKLPSAEPGKQWALDRKTMKPVQIDVPGVQREIPGELVARLGLAGSFFKDMERITKSIEAGSTSGVFGSINLAARRGEAGEVWRLTSDGVDAMQRMLTGAGMPASEAANYSARFLPEAGDMKETQLKKVRNLSRRLKDIAILSARGRMSLNDLRALLNEDGAASTPTQDDPLGIR